MACDKRKIKTKIYIENVNLSYMRKIDITTIFLNLFNNAIEACDEVPVNDRFMEILIQELQGCLLVEVVNSCKKDSFLPKGEGISQKKGHMGVGVVNVKAALERYGAQLNLECNEGKFRAKFVIYENEQ